MNCTQKDGLSSALTFITPTWWRLWATVFHKLSPSRTHTLHFLSNILRKSFISSIEPHNNWTATHLFGFEYLASSFTKPRSSTNFIRVIELIFCAFITKFAQIFAPAHILVYFLLNDKIILFSELLILILIELNSFFLGNLVYVECLWSLILLLRLFITKFI